MAHLKFRVLFFYLLAGGVLATAGPGTTAAEEAVAAPAPAPWYDRAIEQLETTWKEGQPELYLPLHAHHMRFAYSREKIDSFNESNYGLGIGKGYYDQEGDWHGEYFIAFRDSHYKPEYVLGYGYKTFWPMYGELKLGLGYLAFLTARSDVSHYVPFPVAVPMVSFEYRRFSLDSVYVPGGRGNGNILFFFGKYRL